MTQRSRLLRNRAAAVLGVLAIVLNAMVPVHLAYDLAERAVTGQGAPAEVRHDFARTLFALLSGHNDLDEQGHHRGKDHEANCPVCTGASAVATFSSAAPPILVAPVAAAVSVLTLATERAPSAGNRSAGYWSRAPPLA